jgi:hypothetical protein
MPTSPISAERDRTIICPGCREPRNGLRDFHGKKARATYCKSCISAKNETNSGSTTQKYQKHRYTLKLIVQMLKALVDCPKCGGRGWLNRSGDLSHVVQPVTCDCRGKAQDILERLEPRVL